MAVGPTTVFLRKETEVIEKLLDWFDMLAGLIGLVHWYEGGE
jgi:hypothetical protein